MIKITLRQFTQNPTTYLSKLPLELTRYDKTVAYMVKDVTEPQDNVTEGVQPETQNNITEEPKKIISEISEKATTPYNISRGFFQGKALLECRHGYQSKCPICK